MRCTTFIRNALDMSAQFTLALIEDMKDAPLTFPTPRGGNHPLWVLGHLGWSESELLMQMTGRPNPLAHWEPIFGARSEPIADASRYPPFDELLTAFRGVRETTLSVLATLSDADLDRPAAAPKRGFEAILGTYHGCFTIMIFNMLMHRGQVADARRALGRPVMMT